MAYTTPPDFTPFDVLTAAQMDILGNNDISFHDGTGIDDDTILSRQMDIISTTDANGWKIFDFGSTKIYTRRVTFSQTVNTGPTILTASATSLPVGMSTISTNTLSYTWTATGNSGALVIVFEGSSASAGISFVATSTDSNRSYTGFIDEILIRG